ncbi:MAG: APC family permease, partial [Longimicrobiales bacterium]
MSGPRSGPPPGRVPPAAPPAAGGLAAPAEHGRADRAQLPRTLRQRDLVLIVIGSVIGSGIFLVPGVVIRQVQGDVGIALLVWALAGLLSLLGALTYGELGAMQPEAGGLYVYVRDAFGRLPGFLYGWALFFAIGNGAIAALAVAFAIYLDAIIPLGPLAQKVVAVTLIAVMAAINVVGTRKSADVQNVGALIKAGAVVVMGLLLIAFGTGLGDGARQAFDAPLSLSLLSGIGIATISVLWAYEGWQFVTYSAGEVEDPQRAFAGGIVIGTLALTVIYLLANVGYIAALGPEGAGATDRAASDAVGLLFGDAAGMAITLAILVAMYSAAHATALTATRVYFAMARDGLFFHRLAHVHPRYGTPAASIIVSCVWAALLAVSGTFEEILTYVVFVGWIFYGLAGAAVFVYRRRRPDADRPFRVPGYPLTPILFLATAVAIVVNTVFAQPR